MAFAELVESVWKARYNGECRVQFQHGRPVAAYFAAVDRVRLT